MAGIPSGNNIPGTGGNVLTGGDWPTGNNIPATTGLLPPGSPALWFDAANIDGSNNSTLIDGQSIGTWKNLGTLGSGSDAVQATGANKPTYAAIASAGKMNNQPGIVSTVNSKMTIASVALAQPTTWIVVAKDSGTGNQVYFGGNQQMYSGTLIIQLYAGTFQASGQVIQANKFHSLGMFASGAASFGSLDGVNASTVNIGTGAVSTLTLLSDGSNGLIGTTMLILAYTGAGSPTAAQVHTNYVVPRFGATPQ